MDPFSTKSEILRIILVSDFTVLFTENNPSIEYIAQKFSGVDSQSSPDLPT